MAVRRGSMIIIGCVIECGGVWRVDVGIPDAEHS